MKMADNDAMIMLYDEVRQINSMGIIHLNRKDYCGAIRQFHHGLTELNKRLVDPVTKKQTDTDHQKSTPVLASVELTSKFESLFATDTFLMYNRGLVISAHRSDFASSQSVYFQAASVALTYNIGLVHHLGGVERGDSKLLSRALDFYLLAYSSLVDQNRDMSATFSAVFLISQLALASNLGHIHSTVCNYARTALCSEEILLRLNQMLEVLPYSSCPISEDEYKLFLYNACFFREFRSVCASAAWAFMKCSNPAGFQPSILNYSTRSQYDCKYSKLLSPVAYPIVLQQPLLDHFAAYLAITMCCTTSLGYWHDRDCYR